MPFTFADFVAEITRQWADALLTIIVYAAAAIFASCITTMIYNSFYRQKGDD